MRMKLIWPVIAAAVVAGCSGGQDNVGPATADFKSVSATFAARCTICHGDNKEPKDGIDLRSFASVMKGGRDGAVIKAGDPAGSILIQALKGENGRKRMPFNQAPLSEEQIATIEAWIKSGAKEN